MPRTLTPAIRKSDTLDAERRRRTALDHWPDASFEDARRRAEESRFIGRFWAYADPEGLEDEGHRADAAMRRWRG